MRVLTLLILAFAYFVQAGSFIHPNFASCYSKNKKLFKYQEGLAIYPYSKKFSIAYSKKNILKNYIAYDEFLGLYLLKNSNQKSLKFRKTSKIALGEWLGSASDNELYVGNYAKKMDGLESNAKMASYNQENGFLMCLCCEAYGISTGNGEFIETEYIENFIKKRDSIYGSLGVRFKQKIDKIYVSSIDPFCSNRVLNLGDEILTINGKKVKSIGDFKKKILFASPNKKFNIKVKRGSKSLVVVATVSMRFGGGIKSDTYLERFGLYFDDDLKLIKADSFKLKIGDKLLQVNGKKVEKQDQIQDVLSKSGGKCRLLFTRDNFEFFVEI